MNTVARGLAEMVRALAIAAGVTVRHGLRARRGGDRDARRGAFVFALVRALGPIYIKLAQVLAAQSGFISAGFRTELRGTYDRNEIVPFPAVKRQLESAFGRPLEQVFDRFEPDPIGSGSVAQVHRARLRGGEAVAVKLVKPGAAASIASALTAARMLIWLADRLVPSLRPLRLRDNFADVRDALIGQTDLAAERRSQAAIAARFAGHPFLTVPRIHADACAEGVIVMDYVEGVPLYDDARLHGDRAALAERMQHAFYTMVYLHGHFHVDPHPGNMLLMKDGRLALLDFGMVAELGEEDRFALNLFNYYAVTALWTQAVEHFLRLFVDAAPPASEEDALWKEITAVLWSHFGAPSNRWSTAAFLTDAAEVLRRHGLRLRVGMSLLALSLATAEGILHDIDGDIDFWRNARRFVTANAAA
ncbi:MAG: AarF/ABC1/UbiB kinase family protein [Alphaproteobacteria bacterium]|nr:AarF/ABC1/UbiB kinase family protein [Alphaproteobacteria bacterium]MBV9371461.1 AarF/ABC1/UbiB kinase family protein [Alphaproteobacteria bacterium]MBV9902398.1 AarF/ABC1/UbiB kinase family protein [Alphaproteobacteria bacterium]